MYDIIDLPHWTNDDEIAFSLREHDLYEAAIGQDVEDILLQGYRDHLASNKGFVVS